MSKTKEEAVNFIRSVMGPQSRELNEEERKEIWVLLKLIQPISQSNNQHSMAEIYRIGNKEYHVHYGIYDYPVIEEIDIISI